MLGVVLWLVHGVVLLLVPGVFLLPVVRCVREHVVGIVGGSCQPAGSRTSVFLWESVSWTGVLLEPFLEAVDPVGQ